MVTTAIPTTAPATAQKIPNGGQVTEKLAGVSKLKGKVTAVEVKKQTGAGEPHLKHWWIMFNVVEGNASVWMQVDLNLNNGYIIVWSELKQRPLKEGETPPSLGYEPVKFPDGLTSTEVEKAVTAIASQHVFYNNPKLPTDTNPRYSCQTFVQELAGNLGISL